MFKFERFNFEAIIPHCAGFVNTKTAFFVRRVRGGGEARVIRRRSRGQRMRARVRGGDHVGGRGRAAAKKGDAAVRNDTGTAAKNAVRL